MNKKKERNLTSTLSKKIFERDSFKCQICGCTNDLQVHHLKPIYKGGKTVEDNLITLCGGCHLYAPDSENDFLEYKSSPETYRISKMWLACSNKIMKVFYDEEIKNVNDYFQNSLINENVKDSLIFHINIKYQKKIEKELEERQLFNIV